jgi:uncharacterized protein YjbI with pentapeptide repeats
VDLHGSLESTPVEPILPGYCAIISDAADLSGTNMIGADLRGASLRPCRLVGCDLSYASVSQCDFSQSDLRGCLMWRTETQHAIFRDALLSEETDIPGLKMLGT